MDESRWLAFPPADLTGPNQAGDQVTRLVFNSGSPVDPLIGKRGYHAIPRFRVVTVTVMRFRWRQWATYLAEIPASYCKFNSCTVYCV